MRRKNHADNHTVSVVIPSLGRETIRYTKEGLQKQTRKPDEIIVVTDKKLGASWARNKGIGRTKGDLIAFTDDDCIAPPDWLEKLIGAIDTYDVAGAGGTLRETDLLLSDIWLRRKFPTKKEMDDYGWVGNTGNIMYKMSWLERLREHYGYVFDESMPSAEDAECAWRLRQIGAKLIFVPKNVTHLRRMNVLGFFKRQFKRGIGIADLFVVYRAAPSYIANGKSLLWGQRRQTASWLKVIWYNILGPFDIKNFSSRRNFCLFWIGKKFQALGFVWRLSARARKKKN